MAKKVVNEPSIIETCIQRSKTIAACQAAKCTLRETKFFVSRISTPLPSEKYLTELEKELHHIVEEHKMSIARFLKPVLEQKNISIKDTFWFSTSDLINGYVPLYRYAGRIAQILFLSDVKDSSFIEYNNNKEIKAGEVHTYEDVKHFLENVKGVIGKDVILIKYAINKLKKNEPKGN